MDILERLTATASGEWLLTLLVAAVPVLELRGAIPFGVALGLSPWQAFSAALAGNLLPVPFAILFIRRILLWMHDRGGVLSRLSAWLEGRARSKSKNFKRYQTIALILFVAVPLPGTGAWTGALLAALMNIRLMRAFPAIAAGVLIAGLIITAMTGGVVSLVSAV